MTLVLYILNLLWKLHGPLGPYRPQESLMLCLWELLLAETIFHFISLLLSSYRYIKSTLTCHLPTYLLHFDYFPHALHCTGCIQINM